MVRPGILLVVKVFFTLKPVSLSPVSGIVVGRLMVRESVATEGPLLLVGARRSLVVVVSPRGVIWVVRSVLKLFPLISMFFLFVRSPVMLSEVVDLSTLIERLWLRIAVCSAVPSIPIGLRLTPKLRLILTYAELCFDCELSLPML